VIEQARIDYYRRKVRTEMDKRNKQDKREESDKPEDEVPGHPRDRKLPADAESDDNQDPGVPETPGKKPTP